ncbi:hypothetical protein DFS34DRAFT_182067 [Phlyctochytrium arcticum]|nr:hypothetical protein DFS34DRAFT_182067 [Phlyctochytrium arcticum]
MKLPVQRKEVLSLYRRLLATSRQLVYTDKDYYRLRIQEAFRENQNVSDPSRQLRLYNRGQFILDNKIGGLI